MAFALVVLTLMVYWPVLGGGFLHWDDNHNVVFNEQIRELTLKTWSWAWTDVGPDLRYKPLGWLTWAMIVAVFGVDPFGFHLLNLAFHGLNTFLVYGLASRLIRMGSDTAGAPAPTWWAAGATLLWALHPMRVEAVAWISCLPHHISMAFVLGATRLYLDVDFSRSAWQQSRFWGALSLFVGALSAFPLPLGYPAIWLALNIYPLRRIRVDGLAGAFRGSAFRAWLEVGATVAVALVFLGLQLWFRHAGEGHFSPPSTLADFPLGERVMQGIYVWKYYLWRLFFPLHLSPVYLDLFPVRPWAFPFLFSAAVLTLLVMVIWRDRRRCPGAVAVLVAHLGILTPVLGVTEKPHFPGDRYSLIDGLVLSIGLAMWLRTRLPSVAWRRIACVLAIFLVLMTLRLRAYLPVWRDDIALFRTQARQLPLPNRYPAMERLAMALASRGEHREAELWYQLRTSGVEPEELPFELAFMRGLNREKLDDPAGAARFYRAALNVSPGRYFVMYPLGRVLFRLGDYEEGRNWFEAARLIARGEAELDLEYGRALRQAGMPEKAAEVLLEGLTRPQMPAAVREALTAELAALETSPKSRP